ncbi:MAG TPA: protein-L-isoaspartate(D-aspartate) O-methyltransferase [Candidatus Limnocylindrales bacterium]
MKLVAVVIMLVLATAGCRTAASPSPRRDGSPVPVTPPTATAPATRGGATDSPPTGGMPAATVTPAATGTAPTPASSETPSFPIPSSVDRDFADNDEMRRQRDQLVDSYVAPRVTDARVIAAMRAVPRHSFVPTQWLGAAYSDHPLPIGHGQTVSQPSLVAMMTELLEPDEGDRVLEIGTGSGYQAAILRELTPEVYSVEIIPELAGIARVVLDRLGYGDVRIDRRDGYFGWQEHAPYDAIIVTAAPDHLPPPLVAQLDPDGGRLVIPIGPVGDVQVLWLVTRQGDEVAMERVLDVRFVPLTREEG